MSKVSIKFKTKPNALKNAINRSISKSDFMLTCPKCNAQIQVSGTQFGTQIQCPNCSTLLNLDDSNLNDSINKLQKQFDDIWK